MPLPKCDQKTGRVPIGDREMDLVIWCVFGLPSSLALWYKFLLAVYSVEC